MTTATSSKVIANRGLKVALLGSIADWDLGLKGRERVKYFTFHTHKSKLMSPRRSVTGINSLHPQACYSFGSKLEIDARAPVAALSPVLLHVIRASRGRASRNQFNRRTLVENGPKDFKTAAKGVSYCAERT